MARFKCPQCATIVEAIGGTITCPNCGFSAPVPGAAPPTYTPTPPSFSPPAPPAYPPAAPTYAMPPPPAYAAPPPMPRGMRMVGKRREPWVVILLSIITLTIYEYVWYWKVSNEMDKFVGRPDHKKIRTSIVLFLVGVLAVALFAAIFVLVLDVALTEESIDPAAGGLFLAGLLLILVGVVIIIVAVVLLIMGLWKVWKNLEADDRMRGEPNPTNPGLLLVLFILSFFVPYVGFVLTLVAIYMTQSSLNRAWTAYSAPPAVPPMGWPQPG